MKKASSSRVRRSFGDKEMSKGLPPETLTALEACQVERSYPASSMLFAERQTPTEIYWLHTGRVRISICDQRSKELSSRVVEPGEVLGLSAAVLGEPYRATAETMRPSQVSLVKREDFVRLMHDDPEFSFRVCELLSNELACAFEQIRSLLRTSSRKQRS